MATYLQLRGLFNDADLTNRVAVAIAIHAETLITGGTPTTAQKAWIASVLQSPQNEAKKILIGLLAANKDASVSNIQGVTDSVLQTQVGTIAPILIDALAGV